MGITFFKFKNLYMKQMDIKFKEVKNLQKQIILFINKDFQRGINNIIQK